ncbi:unnamed protein product [Zymoseptoria tritici ST99CH_3D7]|uniref:Uncharacterized protein n=2 Tax=Zymoseptoria tritici TaxID=1047171 RepID=A0A1X7REG7_ZYMT9|nr:unnamed protein product [Zymoseptoria tritici ST99CH_3D7]
MHQASRPHAIYIVFDGRTDKSARLHSSLVLQGYSTAATSPSPPSLAAANFCDAPSHAVLLKPQPRLKFRGATTALIRFPRHFVVRPRAGLHSSQVQRHIRIPTLEMPSIRSILLVGLPLAALCQELFDSRRAADVQRHGIVGAGRNAIERAVDMAGGELDSERYLGKRQDSNGTVAATVTVSDVVTATVSSSPTPDTTTSSSSSQETIISVPTTLVSVPVTTEQPSGTTSTEAPSFSAAASSSELGSSSIAAPSSSAEPSSTPPVVDTTASEPAPETSSSPASQPSSTPASNSPSSSAVLPTTTAALPSRTTFAVINSAGSVVTSVPQVATVSDASGEGIVLTSPTPGGVYTNTKSGGDVAVVTYTPDGGTVSEVRYLTETLPNGSASIRTSYATVGAPASPTAGGSSNSGSGSDAPQLQSGAAISSTWYAAEAAVMLGAAVGVAAMML